MSEKNTSRSAFPTTSMDNYVGVGTIVYKDGMTLRQYYKGQALIGILSNPPLMQAVCDENGDGSKVAVRVATLCGLYADKVLEEDETGE